MSNRILAYVYVDPIDKLQTIKLPPDFILRYMESELTSANELYGLKLWFETETEQDSWDNPKVPGSFTTVPLQIIQGHGSKVPTPALSYFCTLPVLGFSKSCAMVYVYPLAGRN